MKTRTYTVHILSPGGNRTIDVRLHWTFLQFECYVKKNLSLFLPSFCLCFHSFYLLFLLCVSFSFDFLLSFIFFIFPSLLFFIPFFLCFYYVFFIFLLCHAAFSFSPFVYISVLATLFLFLSLCLTSLYLYIFTSFHLYLSVRFASLFMSFRC